MGTISNFNHRKNCAFVRGTFVRNNLLKAKLLSLNLSGRQICSASVENITTQYQEERQTTETLKYATRWNDRQASKPLNKAKLFKFAVKFILDSSSSSDAFIRSGHLSSLLFYLSYQFSCSCFSEYLPSLNPRLKQTGDRCYMRLVYSLLIGKCMERIQVPMS